MGQAFDTLMPVKKRRIYCYAEIILSVSGNLVR